MRYRGIHNKPNVTGSGEVSRYQGPVSRRDGCWVPYLLTGWLHSTEYVLGRTKSTYYCY